MPARKLACGIVTALLLTWACSDDPVSPDGELAEEDALEVGKRMSEVLLSGLSRVDEPDPRILGPGIDLPCAGGMVNLRFGDPEIGEKENSISFEYEAKPDGCVLSGENIVIWGDASIAGRISVSFAEGVAAEMTYLGRFRYTAVDDDRSGMCDIDLTENGTDIAEQQSTVSWQGTVCGIAIDHTEGRSLAVRG